MVTKYYIGKFPDGPPNEENLLIVDVGGIEMSCYAYNRYDFPIVEQCAAPKKSRWQINKELVEVIRPIPVIEVLLPHSRDEVQCGYLLNDVECTYSLDDVEFIYFFEERYRSALQIALKHGKAICESYEYKYGNGVSLSNFDEICVKLYEHGAIYDGSIDEAKIKKQCRYPLLPTKRAKEIIREYLKKGSSVIFVNSIDDVTDQFEMRKADIQKKRAEESMLRQAKIEKRMTEVKHDFLDLDLPTQAKLTRDQKMEEYKKIIDFCTKYIPALNEANLHIERVLPKTASKALRKDSADFDETWQKIVNTHRALRLGADGENRVKKLLDIYADRLIYISDYTWGVEHDFIVLTTNGIYTVEVKNLSGEYVFSATGVLKCISKPTKKVIDVAFQSKKHVESLRRNLKNCPSYVNQIPIKHIICSASQRFEIQKNDYPYIPICYTNTLDDYLLSPDLPDIMSIQTMTNIAGYLLANQEPPFKFDVLGPRGEIESKGQFISSFASLVAHLELER